MAVGAANVVVKESAVENLPTRISSRRTGKLGLQRQAQTLLIDFSLDKRNDLLQHEAGKIGRRTDGWVADDVQVGESRQTQGSADASPACFFYIQINGVLGVNSYPV